ncbi:MAG: hypothetical protein PT120_16755, partial [Aphanizomenon gracile PMC649.10]|nr:hypothetical protein [Aphanizomenon gracile PMC649.10]
MKDSEIMSKLLELLADFGEVALDVTLEEGLLKDIPVIGSAIKIATITKNIPNQLFLSKMKRFLQKIDKISQEDKENFIQDLDSKPELKS